MTPNNLKMCLILAVVAHLFLASPLLHAANFKIKPVVVSGDPAPEGGTFGEFGGFSLNNSGVIAFLGGTARFSLTGIYFVSPGGSITRLVKLGDVITGEMNLPGLIRKEDVTQGSDIFTTYFYPDFFSLTTGDRAVCIKTVRGFIPGSLFMNDSGDIVFGMPDGLSSAANNVVLLSGGILTRLDCPALLRLIGSQLSPEHVARIHNSFGVINNVGTVVVKVFTTETISRGSFTFRTFLIRGGIPTHLPLVRTEAPGGVDVITTASILAINDPGEILVFFNEHLFPPPKARGLLIMSGALRIPVAITGQPTIEGKTFSEVQFSADMNNAGEIVFIARLSDGRKGIFHRAPDGTVTPVVRQFDPVPGGGAFFDFHSVLINDNGDVAFRASAGLRSGIFFVGAKGGLSKVVGLGDAAPTGGNFATIESFSLNNKGQIAFGAELSTGRSGIFRASAGLETEFVDPVSALLVGPAITTKEADLAKMGRVVTGIAADGAAQVVVRVKASETGMVEFSLVDREGEGAVLVPADNFHGSLSQVGQRMGSHTVSVRADNVDGVGPMAFAAYHAPIDFARNPTSTAAGQKERKAFIKIRLRTSSGETVESTESFRIVRPPVILVHGVWSKAAEWKNFRPLISDRRFFIEPVDYQDTHAARFNFNAGLVGSELRELISDYRIDERVASVQADLVNHSMGGILVRMLPLLDDGFFRNDNFNLGDVHKVINFGTPNFGTRFAQFLLRSPCVRRVFNDNGKASDQGAVDDLVPNSPALTELNNMLSPLQLHQIVGLASNENKDDTESFVGYIYLRLKCRNDFKGLPFFGFFDTILFTPDHDLVVPAFSQRARAGGNFTPIPNVIHSRVFPLFIGLGEMESRDISKRVIELLNSALRQPAFDTFRIP